MEMAVVVELLLYWRALLGFRVTERSGSRTEDVKLPVLGRKVVFLWRIEVTCSDEVDICWCVVTFDYCQARGFKCCCRVKVAVIC